MGSWEENVLGGMYSSDICYDDWEPECPECNDYDDDYNEEDLINEIY